MFRWLMRLDWALASISDIFGDAPTPVESLTVTDLLTTFSLATQLNAHSLKQAGTDCYARPCPEP